MSTSFCPHGDWLASLDGAFRADFCEVIKDFSLYRLQKYPPPKNGGLFLGHEIRILRRFLSGQSSLLDPTSLSFAYRAFVNRRDRMLYRAFILGDPLTPSEWMVLLDRGRQTQWLEAGLLEQHAGPRISCRFRVICVNGVTLVVDPLTASFPGKVHIGQDSLNMVEFMDEVPCRGRRFLDVGTGAGVMLLVLGRRYPDSLGIDINPRAVKLARFNAELNSRAHLVIEHSDIFATTTSHGKFDLITWNIPFMFLPETEKPLCVDGYGGFLGIDMTLQFAELLPGVLEEGGAAYVLSAAPILEGGENRLEVELDRRLERLGLSATINQLQSFWVPRLRNFHRSHGVRKFESVMLRFNHGRGRLVRVQAPLGRRVTDTLREVLYSSQI